MQIGENPELGKRYGRVSRNLLGLESGKHVVLFKYYMESIKLSLQGLLNFSEAYKHKHEENHI